MHPLVQSAIEAARQGDNAGAMELIRQALSVNPNDVDGWLVLAAVVDQPDRKRQCLERVLALDPTNQIARDELLEIDRAAMGGAPLSDSGTAAVSAPPPAPSPSPYSSRLPASQASPFVQQTDSRPFPQSGLAARALPVEKTLVFKYPILVRIFIYLITAVYCYFVLTAVLQEAVHAWPLLVLFAMCLLVVWVVSPKVELNEAGIRASHIMTSSHQVGWQEITRIKSNAMMQNLELITNSGKSIKISAYLSGYPRIVEILRQKRPDLFGMVAPQTFSGTKVFKRSALSQYGSYFITIPLFLLSVWTVFTAERYLFGAGLTIAVCLLLMISPLDQVGQFKVEPNRLTIEKTFKEKEYSARQIKSISMRTVLRRFGQAYNYVYIQPVNGAAFPLMGFSEGGEVIYGFLMNWWDSYRNS